jgi:hypothetical protein
MGIENEKKTRIDLAIAQSPAFEPFGGVLDAGGGPAAMAWSARVAIRGGMTREQFVEHASSFYARVTELGADNVPDGPNTVRVVSEAIPISLDNAAAEQPDDECECVLCQFRRALEAKRATERTGPLH